MSATDATQTVYLDLETTGLDPSRDDIVEIGILADDGTVLLDTRVRPVRRTAWPEAEAIHGISPNDVRQAPTLAELRETIAALVQGKTVVIYNAQFDSGFLQAELQGASELHCCMLTFAEHYGEWSEWHGNYRWQTLGTAAHTICFEWPGKAHCAIHDAMACRAVWRYLTSPSEQARVDALHQDRVDAELASWELVSWERRQAASWHRHRERLNRWWSAWWLRQVMPLSKRPRDADDYAPVFFGAANDVMKQIDQAADLGLPCYWGHEQVPAYLKTERQLKHEPVREGWYAPLAGCYVWYQGRLCTWLYDTRGNRLRKKLPEFSYGKIPQGFVTAHQLRKRYHLSAKQIQRKRVIGYWRKPYRGEWICLYAPPRSASRPQAQSTSTERDLNVHME